MSEQRNTMIYPPIEELLEVTNSKFSLVTLASKRGRQINAYFNQLGEGLGSIVPPQVTSIARKPLTIALEEIAQGKVLPVRDGEDEQPADATLEETAHDGEDGAGDPLAVSVGETPTPDQAVDAASPEEEA